jgi:hypothetical protein
LRDKAEAVAEAARYGVTQRDILAVLPSIRLRELVDVHELATLDQFIRHLERAVASAGRLPPEVLSPVLRIIEEHQPKRRQLKALAARWGVGARKSAPASIVAVPMIEARKRFNIHRASIVGDACVAIYDLLSKYIPAARRIRREARPRGPGQLRYNQAALELTARIVSAEFFFAGARPITATGVKSRLQNRTRR